MESSPCRPPALSEADVSLADRMAVFEHLLVLSERLLRATLDERWDVWKETFGDKLQLVGRIRNAPPAEPRREEKELLARISGLNVQILLALKEKREMTLHELKAAGCRKHAMNGYGSVRREVEAGRFGLTC